MKFIPRRLTSPQTFSAVSLAFIVGIVVATSFVESVFYREAIIKRESDIMFSMVKAATREEERQGSLSSWDLRHYTDREAQSHLQRSFRLLRNLRGEKLIKVFNPGRVIAWSDIPSFIGTNLTANKEDLARAFEGEVRAVFNTRDFSRDFSTRASTGFLEPTVIEFYVPFTLGDQAEASSTPSGVVAIYLSQEDVDRVILEGTALLWLTTGLGGAILFALLTRLFQSVYYREREAESRFIKLNAEHERIIQIEKLSALGQMVSEIAHQLNNPLVGVVNLAELAQREADNPRRVRELLGDVRRAGEDCREFVQRMLQFNEVSRSEPKLTEMNELIRETVIFFQQSMPGNPDVTVIASDRPVILKVDPVLMRHALFNLIHNAALSEPGGPVTVSLTLDERKGVPCCRIAVADRGPGINPDVAAKLFTPFFSTRSNGTGLGLSVCQHIVVQHGGGVHGENNPEGGACFVIWLPALG